MRGAWPALLAAALLLLAVGPAAAEAETRTFLNTTHLFPSEGAGTGGPALHYPSSIVVSGLAGTVTRATVTLIGLESASPDDIDMVITGPNGQKVMLMSDACGEYPDHLEGENWTFEDAAQTFLPDDGPCAPEQEASFKPSNYLGLPSEPDDLSVAGGPSPPYVNALSFFDGSSPDGAWNLYVLDDNGVAYLGFGIQAWALTLDVEPPPSPAPTLGGAPGTVATGPTGKRAAALARCKKKKTRRARSKCRRHAKTLPA